METLKPGISIAPNLEAGVCVADHWITIAYSDTPGQDGRIRYRWTIIFPDNSEVSGDDLQSGCCGGDLSEGLGSLLAFLSACGESVKYTTMTGVQGENADMFPERVAQFAAQYSDEIATTGMDIETPEGEDRD